MEFVLYNQLGIDRFFEFNKFNDLARALCDITLTEARKAAVNEFLFIRHTKLYLLCGISL